MLAVEKDRRDVLLSYWLDQLMIYVDMSMCGYPFDLYVGVCSLHVLFQYSCKSLYKFPVIIINSSS